MQEEDNKEDNKRRTRERKNSGPAVGLLVVWQLKVQSGAWAAKWCWYRILRCHPTGRTAIDSVMDASVGCSKIISQPPQRYFCYKLHHHCKCILNARHDAAVYGSVDL